MSSNSIFSPISWWNLNVSVLIAKLRPSWIQNTPYIWILTHIWGCYGPPKQVKIFFGTPCSWIVSVKPCSKYHRRQFSLSVVIWSTRGSWAPLTCHTTWGLRRIASPGRQAGPWSRGIAWRSRASSPASDVWALATPETSIDNIKENVVSSGEPFMDGYNLILTQRKASACRVLSWETLSRR